MGLAPPAGQGDPRAERQPSCSCPWKQVKPKKKAPAKKRAAKKAESEEEVGRLFLFLLLAPDRLPLLTPRFPLYFCSGRGRRDGEAKEEGAGEETCGQEGAGAGSRGR